jgi:hypothetical protein
MNDLMILHLASTFLTLALHRGIAEDKAVKVHDDLMAYRIMRQGSLGAAGTGEMAQFFCDCLQGARPADRYLPTWFTGGRIAEDTL